MGSPTKARGFLTDRGVRINHRLDWIAKNDITHYFLAHTLAVAETMLQFQFATRDAAISLVDHHELLPEMSEANALARSLLHARAHPPP